jgi:hypothetical protein
MKNKITVHENLEKLSESQAIYAASQSPVERIKETVELILRVFPLKKKKANTNHIYFD